ncbi:hypothetical protein M573_102104 [Prevotella intermedia ZT]|uniref:Uncharacterized protein n=1 Tax=Prevotella intermedia ZT TaxID=1347790 RepID=A0AAP0YPJ2_PREIN|nr:hypothetical protein M573_102104 [Prevotella intermedia ZT]
MLSAFQSFAVACSVKIEKRNAHNANIALFIRAKIAKKTERKDFDTIIYFRIRSKQFYFAMYCLARMLVTIWLSVENLLKNSAFVPFEQPFLHRFYDNKIKT